MTQPTYKMGQHAAVIDGQHAGKTGIINILPIPGQQPPKYGLLCADGHGLDAIPESALRPAERPSPNGVTSINHPSL